jgi:hypothetical protein
MNDELMESCKDLKDFKDFKDLENNKQETGRGVSPAQTRRQ